MLRHVDHAFGMREPYAVGIEEELLLVDARTLELSHASSEILARVTPGDGALMHDTYEAVVEAASPVCPDAVSATRTLAGMRAALRSAGALTIGAGIHPDGAFGDVVHVDSPRYLELAGHMRGLFGRTPTCALHLHVGMPDPETAIRACTRMRAFLPLLQALAAHSPFWHGTDSGFASARANLFRGLPHAGIPRAFSGWDEYLATVDAVVAAGDARDYTFLWWDIRPHPRLGTLEIRIMDAQSRLDSVAGLCALAHGLAVHCAHEVPAETLPPTEALAESSFRAARDGLAATLWWDGAMRPVPEIARRALTLAVPHARDTGTEAALEEIERILAEGNGADRMRAAHRRGGMRAVLEHLAAEAAAPYGAA